MTRDDVIDVLTVVAAATRRTVGEADVEIWQGVMGDLDKADAILAVRDHLRERPGVWLEPGHLVERVRAKTRDRLERESDGMREARQAALDAKVAEEIAERAGCDVRTLKFDRPTARHGVNPLSVRCPWCHAGVSQPCVVPQTSHRPAGGAHPSRIDAAKTTVHA